MPRNTELVDVYTDGTNLKVLVVDKCGTDRRICERHHESPLIRGNGKGRSRTVEFACDLIKVFIKIFCISTLGVLATTNNALVELLKRTKI